jgi:hypothetical protein
MIIYNDNADVDDDDVNNCEAEETNKVLSQNIDSIQKLL